VPEMKWRCHPNLAKRPYAPAKGRGRLQRQVRRALIVHGPLVTTSQLLDWTYPRKRRRPTGWDHSKVMRICAEHCDRIERVPPYGAWLWRPKPALSRGRLQVQVRRAFTAADAPAISAR
jgi:hypothetical protein